MKAVIFAQHGSIDQLAWSDWPEPECAATEVLVSVQAVALNGFDPMVLQGIPTLRTPLPMIPCGDVAGTVAAIGKDVPSGLFAIGDAVLANPLLPGRGLLGETLRGGLCERIALPYQQWLPLPANVSMTDAVCLPIAYGTAYRMMHSRGQVGAGDKVLVLGATGGVGTCCVQLAKLAGAEVMACTSSASKGAQLRALGADHVVVTTERDYIQAVIEQWGKPRVFSGGGGADITVNFVGGDDWTRSLKTVRRGGKLLTCGATNGYAPQEDIRYIWSFELALIGSNAWTQADLNTLVAMVADGRLKPAVHAVMPMSEVRQAYRDFVGRKTFGKVVLVP